MKKDTYLGIEFSSLLKEYAIITIDNYYSFKIFPNSDWLKAHA